MIDAANVLEDIPVSEHYGGEYSDRNWECKYCPLKDVVCPGGGGERMPWFSDILDMGVVE